VAVLISTGSLPAIGCSSAHHPQTRPQQPIHGESLNAAPALNGWCKIDAEVFSIFAPLGWEFQQLQGVDSYVGEFVGDGIALRFDFGIHSSGYLKKTRRPAYAIARKHIGGVPAQIVSPRIPGHGLTGAYFRNVGHSNGLFVWGQDLTTAQQELVLKIFETIRFGGTAPGYVVPPPSPSKNTQ
jgi:hypothetical protein